MICSVVIVYREGEDISMFSLKWREPRTELNIQNKTVVSLKSLLNCCIFIGYENETILGFWETTRVHVLYSRMRVSFAIFAVWQKMFMQKKHSINAWEGHTRFFIFKKVFYKKVYIKQQKIKKVLIYNLPKLRNFIRKSVRKCYMLTHLPSKNFQKMFIV